MQPAEDADRSGLLGRELAGALAAAAPDVEAGAEQGRRKDLIRQRLLGAAAPVRIGRFTVLGLVGSGAMSVVYAAYDEELDRKVAVKLLRAPLALGDERLRREAQAMARLAHPHVVAVHEIGSWEGRLFVAMEFVKGQTLEGWLGGGQRTWREIVEIFLQAGRGLAAAHALGLVHRDFKPANVMVGEDGRARVLDFGLVRWAESAGAPQEVGPPAAAQEVGGQDGGALAQRLPPLPAPPAAGPGSLTATGACVGTPAYMAPEQRAGAAADARSDQYSFCVALHEALRGARPGEPAPPAARRRGAAVPARLTRVLERGLATEPGKRWASMVALLDGLARVHGAARRWRLRAAVIGGAALVAVGALVAGDALARLREEGLARAAVEAAAARQAEHERALAHDARLVTAAQLHVESDPTVAAALLREVRFPDEAGDWPSAATAALMEPVSRATLQIPEGACQRAELSLDGQRALIQPGNGDVLVLRVDGAGTPTRLRMISDEDLRWSAKHEWSIAQGADSSVALTRIDGSVVRTIDGPIADAAVTKSGDELVTVSPVGVIRRWGVTGPVRGTTVGRIPIDDLTGWALNLSSRGTYVRAAAPSGGVWIWRIGGAQAPIRVNPAERAYFRIRVSPDERWLAVLLEDNAVELWDLATGGAPVTLRGHTEKIRTIDFSPDGRWLATGSHDRTARLWPLGGRAGPSAPKVLRGHEGPLGSVRFSPDGRRVVTGSYDRTVRVWSTDDSGDVMVLRGHRHNAGGWFGPDGQTVITCSERVVRLWDVSAPPVRVLGQHADKIWDAALDPAGHRLITAGHDQTAKIWDLLGDRPPITLRGHTGVLYQAMFSPDGQRVATSADDGTARIWSADGAGDPVVIRDHFGWAYGLAFSPDGRRLATGAKDGEIRISAVDGTGPAQIIQRGAGTPYGVSRIERLRFSPTGDRLLAGGHGRDSAGGLWSLQGEPRSVVLGDPRDGQPAMIAVGPDGRLATGAHDGVVRLWRPDGAGPIATLRGHDGRIHDLAFSRDGRRLLSASFDHTARVWDLERGESRLLAGHTDWVNTASFDAAERRVVTASSDGIARVWDLEHPEWPIVLHGHTDHVSFAAFTAQGRVVTASYDGSVRLWNLDAVTGDAAALMERLREITSVCLNAPERQRLLRETVVEAEARRAECERAAGRAP